MDCATFYVLQIFKKLGSLKERFCFCLLNLNIILILLYYKYKYVAGVYYVGCVTGLFCEVNRTKRSYFKLP